MGITSALRLLEAGFTDVTLVAEKLSAITSKTSPGVFRPDWVGNTSTERVIAWGLATREHYSEVYRDAGSAAGISTLVHLEICRTEAGKDAMRQPRAVLPHVMAGFREMTPSELKCHFPTADAGYMYSSFVVEGNRYLPYLLERATRLGLHVLEHRVDGTPGTAAFCRNAVQVAGRPACRIVVNATGINGGPECYPVRGQLVLVKAPYQRLAMGEYCAKDPAYPTYIYPRRDHVVLGSTYLEHDGDREEREETTASIIKRCAEFNPELASAPILSVVVCIRPGRKEGVRLDHTLVADDFHVISNYGHGGAGISLAWGCAGDVVHLAQQVAGVQTSRL